MAEEKEKIVLQPLNRDQVSLLVSLGQPLRPLFLILGRLRPRTGQRAASTRRHAVARGVPITKISLLLLRVSSVPYRPRRKPGSRRGASPKLERPRSAEGWHRDDRRQRSKEEAEEEKKEPRFKTRIRGSPRSTRFRHCRVRFNDETILMAIPLLQCPHGTIHLLLRLGHWI